MLYKIETNKICKYISLIISVFFVGVLGLTVFLHNHFDKLLFELGIVITCLVWLMVLITVLSKYSKIYIFEDYLCIYKFLFKKKIFFNDLGSICVVKNYIYGRLGGFYDCSFELQHNGKYMYIKKHYFYKVYLNTSTISNSKEILQALENSHKFTSFFGSNIVAEIDFSIEAIDVLKRNTSVPFFMSLGTYKDIINENKIFDNLKASFNQIETCGYIVKLQCRNSLQN